LDVIDPVKKTTTKEPLKPFMVNQLALAFERSRVVLSPFDEVLHKQLVDYCVEKITESGLPKYTSKEEHFVDALGLAYLAFVLKFPDIAKGIKEIKFTSKMEHSSVALGAARANAALREISQPIRNPWQTMPRQIGKEPGERKGDYQKWVKVPMGSGRSSRDSSISWGSRTGYGTGGRSMW